MDIAISPDNFFSIGYNGFYNNYRETDNFKEEIHRANAFWKWVTPKGSLLRIGGSVNFDSIQPYSLQDAHKDFTEKKLFGETAFEVSSFIHLGISYEHTVQRFDKSIYESDDYDRDTAAFRIFYKRLTDITFTADYSYFYQNNNGNGESSADLDAHVVLLGVLWDPSKKLSGHLKSGYYRVSSKNDMQSNGFALDADIEFRFTEIILLNLMASRRAVTSVRTAREPGEYYISTGGGLKVSYSGFNNLLFTLSSLYRNNAFKEIRSVYAPEREDDYFDVGITVRYAIQKWLSFITTYHYRVNQSTVDNEDYTVNSIEAQFRLAL